MNQRRSATRGRKSGFEHHCSPLPYGKKRDWGKIATFPSDPVTGKQSWSSLSDTPAQRLPIGQWMSRGVVFSEYDYTRGKRRG
ncbi:hypothetical protein NPIL_213821 [Nephila pilipes]|uniref:Uncharacterized protein n=1 Tax=Nephila pilipes TaxID=299642 RepID=A0A8X6TUG3_NEPPI|nr:hypothetical protein NPIL_213821 [Nephila pilipes]